ncbi:factor of DNA methylation 5-like [Fagus crenata]
MGSCSEEQSDVSDSEIEYYIEKPYEQLKAGKYIIKNPNATFRCPFCGKRKQEYRYHELLQHASGVGTGSANRRSAKNKAKHLALAKYLEENLVDDSHSTQSKAEPRHVIEHPEQDELFVWPWKGIVANIPRKRKHEKEVHESVHWLKKFSQYQPVEVHVLWKDQDLSGYVILDFGEGWSGLCNVRKFDNDFQAVQHGKKDWDEWKEYPGSELYGWCARADDYHLEGPVGDYLREKAELKTVADIMKESTEERNTTVVNLAKELDITNENLNEMEFKYNEKSMSVSRMIEENDRLHQAYNQEMERMQHVAQNNALRIIEETEKLKYELESKSMELDKWCQQLTEQEVLNICERRKLEEEKKRKNEVLHLASVSHMEASSSVLRLLEEQQREKQAALDTMLKLERELASKQKLQLEIEQLRGQLKVMECMGGENDKAVKKKMEEMEEELKEKVEQLEDVDTLNQTLIIKEREMNDQLQEARREMIAGLSKLLNGRTIIGIKRLGEISVKPFQKECKKRYPADGALEKSAILCSKWQEYIQNPGWYPFKVVKIDGKEAKEVIDEEDEKLNKLRKEWGEEVYMAVVTALKELNEYNPSGRYVISELYNFRNQRKATLKEVIAYILERTSKKPRR